MRHFILLLTIASLLAMTTGCADGPLRRWMRGSACNTCQPPLGQPQGCGTNFAPGCNSGACGTGVMGAPASISADQLNSPTGYYQENGQGVPTAEIYGNPATLGTPTGNPNFNTPTIGPANGG